LLLNWPVKILSLVAAVMLYYINYYSNLTNLKIEVPIEVFIPSEYAHTAPYTKTTIIAIRGNAGLGVEKLTVDDFEVVAMLVDENSIKINEPLNINLMYNKKGKALALDPLSVLMTPSRITIKVEKRITRTVEIVPDYKKPSLPEGYYLTAYKLTPDKIRITGPESRVKAIDKITTEPIVLENRKKDFVINVKPLLPNSYVTTVDFSYLEYSATIAGILTEKSFENINIFFTNINDLMMIENELPTGVLTLKATENALKNLNPEKLRMSINAENIKQPGKYTLRIITEIPPDIILSDYTPKEVVIDLVPRRQ